MESVQETLRAVCASRKATDEPLALARVVRRTVRPLQMSFCGVFPFATRPRGIRESSETGLIMSYHPMFDQEHDLCQHSRDWGWSFEEFDEFSFVRQVELEKDTDVQSDDTSSHLSLTTGSLLRLVTKHNAAAGIITSQKTLASAQTPILRPRGPSLNNHTSFSSLAAGTVPSSPCTQCKSLNFCLLGPLSIFQFVPAFLRLLWVCCLIWEQTFNGTFP